MRVVRPPPNRSGALDRRVRKRGACWDVKKRPQLCVGCKLYATDPHTTYDVDDTFLVNASWQLRSKHAASADVGSGSLLYHTARRSASARKPPYRKSRIVGASHSRRATRGPNDGSRVKPDEPDWGKSIPSYLQSTISTELCDDWSNAISQAEGEAAARQRAVREGRNPDAAAAAVRISGTSSRAHRVWERIRQEASKDIESEPVLSSFLFTSILSHNSFGQALAFVLSNRVADQTLLPTQLFSLFVTLMEAHPEVLKGAVADLEAVFERDPACMSYSQALLYFKGFHAVQIHRFAHALWRSGRKVMALSLQSRLSEVLAVDIHPAAHFGRGILVDHGTGLVIGETAVVGNGVSIMQNVTLGGTGKEVGDRHPKVHANVLIGAGASVLGNIEVGTGAQIAAGSLVLKPVEQHTMVAGSPAKCVGRVTGNPAALLNQWDKSIDYEGQPVVAQAGAGGPPGQGPQQGGLPGDNGAGGGHGDVAPARAEQARHEGSDGRRVVPTRAGHVVQVLTEADYMRHIDAEQSLLRGAASGGPRAPHSPPYARNSADSSSPRQTADKREPGAAAEAGPQPVRVTSTPSHDDPRAGLEALVAHGAEGDATLSDAEAEQRWGHSKSDPEFFI